MPQRNAEIFVESLPNTKKGSDTIMMTAITSGDFIREFTLYADRTHEANETFIIQRENGKHLVLISMDSYNALQKELYLARKHNSPEP